MANDVIKRRLQFEYTSARVGQQAFTRWLHRGRGSRACVRDGCLCMARTAAETADVAVVVVVHVSVVVVAARRRSRTIACDRIIYSNCPTIYVRTRALTRKCTHWGARARGYDETFANRSPDPEPQPQPRNERHREKPLVTHSACMLHAIFICAREWWATGTRSSGGGGSE